jgi:hypothetical protein
MRRAGFLLLALALAACQRHHDDHHVASDLQDAGHSVDRSLARLSHDPDVKRAAADLKQAGKDAGKDLSQAAAEARAAARRFKDDAHEGAGDQDRRDNDSGN